MSLQGGKGKTSVVQHHRIVRSMFRGTVIGGERLKRVPHRLQGEAEIEPSLCIAWRRRRAAAASFDARDVIGLVTDIGHGVEIHAFNPQRRSWCRKSRIVRRAAPPIS